MLQVKGLSFGFANRPALFSGLTLNIASGQSLGILGPSGSGKSTLLKLLSGKLEAEKGEVLFEGRPVIATGRDLTFEKNFLFSLDQGIHLPTYRSVRELFRIRLRQLPYNQADAMIEEIGNDFGIGILFDQRTETLSLGQAQRVGLALGVCLPNQFVILDEPFSHQDPLNRQRLLFQLKKYEQINTLTYVVASHSAEDCMILTDRCLYLNGHGNFTTFANWQEFYQSSGLPEIKAYFRYLTGAALQFNPGNANPKMANVTLETRFIGAMDLNIGYDAEGFPSLKAISRPAPE